MISLVKQKKIYTFFIIALFLTVFSFGLYSFITGVISFGELEDKWDGESVATSFHSGNGTEDNPYVINDASEFIYFQSLIEGEHYKDYQDKFYILGKDIDFNNHEITPIGKIIDEEERYFKGNFNGDGFSLLNFKITSSTVIDKISYYSLFSIIENSTIQNIGLRDFNISSSMNNDDLSYLSILIGKDYSTIDEKSILKNIFIDGFTIDTNLFTNKDNKINLLGIFDYSEITNLTIFGEVKSEFNYQLGDFSTNSSISNIVDGVLYSDKVDLKINNYYVYKDNKFYLNDEEISYDSILSNLNENYGIVYYWDYIDNDFIIKKYEERKKVDVPISSKSFSFSIRSVGAINLHDSGTEGTSIYVNDLDKDYNYYMGLNYASSSDGSLPTRDNKNLYSTSNLAKVYIHYDSRDYSDDSIYGTVSLTESYTDYYYYKYYPIIDGYVTFDLIDNPWANRPNGLAFNGWVTDYQGAVVSLDNSYYVRQVRIPASSFISIEFKTSWIPATIVNGNSFSGLNSAGMELYEPIVNVDYGDVSEYYVLRTQQAYTNYPTGRPIYNLNGNQINNRRCTNFFGCQYLIQSDSSVAEDGVSYYRLTFANGNYSYATSVEEVEPTITTTAPFDEGELVAGNFEQVIISNGSSIDGYYDEDGNILSGSCTRGPCTVYKYLQFYDELGNVNIVDLSKNYYYLVTRDTNIMVLTGNISGLTVSKPVTVTGINNGVDYGGSITISRSSIVLNSDCRIEQLYIDSSSYSSASLTTNSYYIGYNLIVANYHNLKIGRGIEVANNRKISGIFGGTALRNGPTYGSASNPYHYSLIVESGFYNNIYFSESFYGAGTMYLYGLCTLGNDLDRVSGNNDNLDVYYSFQGNAGSSLTMRGQNDIGRIYDIFVKSGKFGSSKSDLYTGIYVGGRGGNIYGNRAITIEGGYVYTIIGGLGSISSQQDLNSVYIYMKAGSVDAIFGGSGSAATYGNRIISVTGGTVNYSIFGGSNGSTINESSSDTGILYGDSYIYVGGNSIIGVESGTLFGANSGSVFGAGAGNDNKDGLGSVDNSNIVIGLDTTINGSVYGGGNYGSVGAQSTSSTSTTNIKVLGGTIKESIYGGGNNNGSGNSNSVTSTINIEFDGGTVNNSIYGGSRTNGTIYGTVNLSVNGGKVLKDVYGGGEGGYTSSSSSGTYVRDDVNVVINDGTIDGSVYGGSAFGTVNAVNENTSSSTHTTNVSVHGGVVKKNVFGGGKGDEDYTPKVVGDITVLVDGGNVGSVFGGFDASGKPSNGDVVYLNGGTIGNAYGGGNNANQDVTDIRLQGSTITENLYGGSNLLGTVTSSNVTVTSGSVKDVFGGNNMDGLTITSHVNINGSTITGNVYGGGNQADTTTTNVTINGGTLNDVYGGGYSAGVQDETNITILNGTMGNVFGGSNTLGDVGDTHITINSTNPSKSISAVYGGNNLGGTTSTSDIDITAGVIGNVYGGGNKVGLTTSDITAVGGTIDSIFGGSNQAGDVTASNVVVGGDSSSVEVGSVYGGNNEGGVTDTTHVTIHSGTIQNVYGGGNEADVNSTTVIVNNGNIFDVYGGGNAASVLGSTSLDINGGIISNNVYGGGNEGIVSESTNVTITNANIQGNAFAGGNGSTAVVYKNSTITIDGTTIIGTDSSTAPDDGCVFGSGNAASTGLETENNSIATVNIVGGIIHGNVYGGPKMAVVYGTTETNIGSATVNNSSLNESDIHIYGTVFGGGESNASGSETYDWTFISVTEGINVHIDGTNYISHNHDFIINGSIFGSGNASSSSGTSNIYVKNLGSKELPNQAISIQRANYLEIDSSVMELAGTTDRTNEYSDILYSFNMIDKMVIKNGTTLLLKHNANMLKELYSGVDSGGELVPAVVDIDDENKTVTKNVDNRIYMIPGQNLNVTINQSATAYGKVTGMTFFGMYNSFEGGGYRYGLYDDSIQYGDSGNASLAIVGGSYVMGLRHENHDITKDGFYSNFLDEDTHDEITTAYIDPSRIGEKGYRWIIGFEAINYEFTLTASRYSSLGTYELQMIHFAEGDTKFTVLGFDSSGLKSGLSFVDSTSVPRVGRTEEEANNILGLSMKSETQEWTGYGTTKLLSTGGGDFTGDSDYRTDSRKLPPSLMFYLYHAKNITRVGPMGTVVVTLQAAVPKNAIEDDIKFITITIHLTAVNVDSDSYDASITYDKRYEMPSSTSVNITNKSQFSAYYSLTAWKDKFESIYGKNNDYVHVLVSNHVLPVNTMITMLDYGANPNRPEYYYFKVTDSIYQDSLNQLSQYNEVTYRLSNFIKMDSTSTDNTYDDASNNLIYYDSEAGLVDEEFMFIFDFKECEVEGNHLNNTMLFELRNSEERTIYSVFGIREGLMVYNTFESSNVVLNQQFNNMDSYLYYNIPDEFSYSTQIQYNETENRESVIDTNYESSKMGLNVVLFNHEGEQVSSSLLVGTSIYIGNQEYFADGDGVFRIKLANKVSNLNRVAKIVVNKDLPAGSYTIRYTLFASDDGLHNSSVENSVTREFPVVVVSADNSIMVDCDDGVKLVDGATSLNYNGVDTNKYTVKYHSQLSNPNFRIEIFKRDTTTIDSTQFSSVSFQSLFQNSLPIVSGNEVSISMGNDTEKEFEFKLQDSLISGTYRIAFKLYDNDQLIDEEYKYVIVQKKIE